MNKKEVGDDELLYFVRQGNEWALRVLMNHYQREMEPVVVQLMKQNQCGEYDDANQMILMGIQKAIDTYREDKQASFGYYVKICAECELRNLLRGERSKGLYSAGNYATSLDKPKTGDYQINLSETLPNHHPEFDPQWMFDATFWKEMVEEVIENLPKRDQNVYHYWMQKVPYHEIAERLVCQKKDVDLSVQRIKRALRNCVDYRI